MSKVIENHLVYEDEAVKLYHGDVRSGLPLADGEAQVLVTSPPYNVAISYDEWTDTLPWPVYFAEIVEPTCREAARVLADGCRSWVNVAPVVQSAPGGRGRNAHNGGRSEKERVNLAAEWAARLEGAGMRPADMVVWASQRGSGTAWGSYEMPSAPNLRGDYEVVHLHHAGAADRGGPDAAVEDDNSVVLFSYHGDYARAVPPQWKGWRDTLGDWPALVSNVWKLRPERRSANGHPAPFPVELAENCIRLSTWPGELVIDPFAGQGSTLVAAKRLGRRAVGIEYSSDYCDLAIERLRATEPLEEVGTFRFGPNAAKSA